MRCTNNFIQENKDVECYILWIKFSEDLIKSVETHIPHKMNRPPWITGQVKKLIKARIRLFRKYRKATKPRPKELFRKYRKATKPRPKELLFKNMNELKHTMAYHQKGI